MLTIEELLTVVSENFAEPYSSDKLEEMGYRFVAECQNAFIFHLPHPRVVEIIDKYPEFIKYFFANLFASVEDCNYQTFCSVFIKMKYFNLDAQVEKILEILGSEEEDEDDFGMLLNDYDEKEIEMQLWVYLFRKNYAKFQELYNQLCSVDDGGQEKTRGDIMDRMNRELLGEEDLLYKKYFPNIEFPKFLPLEIFCIVRNDCFFRLIFPINPYSELIYAMYFEKLTMKSLLTETVLSPVDAKLLFHFMRETSENVHSFLEKCKKSHKWWFKSFIRDHKAEIEKFLKEYPTHQSKLE